MSNDRTKEQIYDEEIFPLIKKAAELAQFHGNAMLSSFCISELSDPDIFLATYAGKGQDGYIPDRLMLAFHIIMRDTEIVEMEKDVGLAPGVPIGTTRQ